MATPKFFSVSQLSPMLSSDISDSDLFLVTDVDEKNSNKKSKKLTYGDFKLKAFDDFVKSSQAKKLSSDISSVVYFSIKKDFDKEIDSKIDSKIGQKIKDVSADILDASISASVSAAISASVLSVETMMQNIYGGSAVDLEYF